MSKWKEALARIRDLPEDELGQARERAREELFRLRLGNYTNQVENTVSLRLKRRELARILTIERARDLAIEAQTHAAARPAEEPQQDEEPQTVADRARAAVGRPRPKAKAAAKKPAPSSRKSGAKPAAKPAARSASKAKAGAKSSKKKSGKE